MSEILLAGQDPGIADHYLWCTPRTVTWGTLPTPRSAPVLRIASGETVTFDTVSQEGLMEDQGRDPVRYFGAHGVPAAQVLDDAVELARSDLHRMPSPAGPHIVLGPVHVDGALPGDWLRVDFLELRPRVPYGVISTRHGRGLLPGRFPEPGGEPVQSAFCRLEQDPDGGGTRARFAHRGGSALIGVRPFLGLCGVTPAGSTPRSSIPPGPFGGNIDLRELVAGTSLYLPVQTAGAGFYLGDPHLAQGNGEIALTALEGSLRVTVRLSLAREPAPPPVAPWALTPRHWILTGLDADLDEAMRRCAEQAVELLVQRTGMTPTQAYLYLSAAGDFAVTQVVDRVKGVHCLIDRSPIEHGLIDRNLVEHGLIEHGPVEHGPVGV
ncbi:MULTISPECIES: acetamidase/formamidase family protein [Pseudonocardia]|uniref:Formamidase n=2 Tax=Pseudonocardia TaxID=1847 RepID=A0A1Y2MU59_PSEAH|nr:MULTISPECIES: acetamidase/formamidase family protein [Pseudonocardia]OSY38509.1 Formamidase [Pseudonocardia autotrophica]TDN77048.1 acetamidase/formamidase [Pseudonocardia autotrophica]BBG01054.1 formamidase [Pseudonocardia autotrophica]GEC26682.1 formamidase [Pseudonocardia saturnea]